MIHPPSKHASCKSDNAKVTRSGKGEFYEGKDRACLVDGRTDMYLNNWQARRYARGDQCIVVMSSWWRSKARTRELKAH